MLRPLTIKAAVGKVIAAKPSCRERRLENRWGLCSRDNDSHAQGKVYTTFHRVPEVWLNRSILCN